VGNDIEVKGKYSFLLAFTVLPNYSFIPCKNEDTATIGDLFILDLSIEYPLTDTAIVHQQHFFDKIKINNSSAYKQFNLSIILTNGQALDVKMNLCSVSQVTSSGMCRPLQLEHTEEICIKQNQE